MQSIEARIPDVSTAQVLPVISDFADLLELPLETRADSLTLRLTGGQIALRDSLGGIDLRLEAESARRLYRLQQMVLTRFDGLDPVPHLDWERVEVGALPPGHAASSLSQGARLLSGMRRDILSCSRRRWPGLSDHFCGRQLPRYPDSRALDGLAHGPDVSADDHGAAVCQTAPCPSATVQGNDGHLAMGEKDARILNMAG